MLAELKPFTGHLRGRGRPLAALFALSLVSSAVSLATPLVGRAFIDAVVERGEYGIVPWIAAILVAIAVSDLLLGLAQRLVHARLSADVLVDLRQRLFAHCLGAPVAGLETFRHGDLMSRFGSDLPKIQSLLVDGVLGALRNVLFLLVAAGVLVWMNPVLAAWSFLGLGVALVATALARGPVEAGSRGIREAMADLAHFLSERLGALRAVRYHGAAPAEAARFGAHNRTLVARVIRFQWVDCLAGGIPGLALSLNLAWIYLLGGGLLESGEMGLGTFIAFVLYQGRLYGPARGLMGLVRSLQEARVSLERIAEVLGEEAPAPGAGAVGTATGAGGAALELDGVSFSYPGKPPVLGNVRWRVERGERVALFGPSGVGKSSLVQLLFGLRAPAGGRIRVLGEPPGGATLPARIGYAGCEPFLLHATVEENIRYSAPGATGEAMADAARLAEAHGFILSLPEGYRTVIGGRGLALSDGQRQRIGLARLILQRPQILVLDEAFSGLDPATERRIRRNLWQGFRGQTILAISHRLDGLEAFDRLFYVADRGVHEIAAAEVRSRLAGAARRPSAYPETPSVAERS
jgi:ABC-type multidrug transport system fused ATPase/permease subunit